MNTSQAIPRHGHQRLYLFALLTVLLALAILPLGCSLFKEKVLAPSDTPIVISGGTITIQMNRNEFYPVTDLVQYKHEGSGLGAGKIYDNNSTGTIPTIDLSPQTFTVKSKIQLQHNDGGAGPAHYVDVVVIECDPTASPKWITVNFAQPGVQERSNKASWVLFYPNWAIDKVIVTGSGRPKSYFPHPAATTLPADEAQLPAGGKMYSELSY